MNKSIHLFTADYCAACPRAKLELMKGARDAGFDMDNLMTFDMSTEAAQRMAMRHKVTGLPTVNLMDGDMIVDSITGSKPEHDAIYYESKIRHFMEDSQHES